MIYLVCYAQAAYVKKKGSVMQTNSFTLVACFFFSIAIRKIQLHHKQIQPPHRFLLLHDINKIALMICQEMMHILPSSRFQSLSRCMRIPTRILPCISHRSLTRQHRGRCSRCLTRLTKSCTKEEAAEEGSSRGCRMNVSSGPLISRIFGMSSAFSREYPDF